MNNLKNLFLFGIISILALSSCDKNDDNNNVVTVMLNQAILEYNADGVWANALVENSKTAVQGLEFNHSANPQWGSWDGFVPSRNRDVADYNQSPEKYNHSFTSTTGGGMSGLGTPYFVAYWNSSEGNDPVNPSCSIKRIGTGLTFVPQSILINNTTLTYYDMLNGSDYSKKFTDSDYLKLLIYGRTADGTVTGPVEAYLAEGLHLINSWTYVSLDKLGEISELYFQMESSDSGMWGMNTPAYFAMDRLTVEMK